MNQHPNCVCVLYDTPAEFYTALNLQNTSTRPCISNLLSGHKLTYHSHEIPLLLENNLNYLSSNLNYLSYLLWDCSTPLIVCIPPINHPRHLAIHSMNIQIKFFHSGSTIHSGSKHSIFKSYLTLRSLLWDRRRSWMYPLGSLEKLSIKSRCIFS